MAGYSFAIGFGIGVGGLESISALVLSMIDELLSEPPLTVMGDMTDVEIYDAFVIFNGEEV